ncbi:hypothetical protein CIL03_08065 [Virgibacillus indicus]|uniref:Calcineurin-like phosphoesterase domain-containing protein n=1 Tax=Virgibacillus indicus TaxID=2024554 RepID=A0A265NCG1_9BACI|nr:metallophosphoesterase [Virgibacillus indicus]OZU88966.1 hypothetical protein CIL03_08065 [Virgibacillus indicus]
MRTFFISDIHGNFCAFKKLIDHVKFSPGNDKLIIGGDMINMGPRSAPMLQWARDHNKSYPDTVHILAGNHEEMMVWFINELSPIWMEFGGDETIGSFKKVYGSENGWDMAEDYASWLETLPLVYEDENGIYTHAGIDLDNDTENQSREIIWMNKKELMQLDEQNVHNWSKGKLIYRGHNPSYKVQLEKGFVNCDLGISVLENDAAALALIEVKRNRYFRCNMNGDISVHSIEK